MLAPLSGPYSEIGNSLLYSLQLALEEINDENVIIVPKTLALIMKKKLILLSMNLRLMVLRVIIGPTTYQRI